MGFMGKKGGYCGDCSNAWAGKDNALGLGSQGIENRVFLNLKDSLIWKSGF